MEIGTYINAANQQFERIEDEDLWQDGELGAKEVSEIIFQRVVNTGDWILIRRIDG